MIRCFKKTLEICQLFCNVVGLVQQLKLSTRWVNRVRLAEDYQEKEETLFSGKGALKNREDVYLEEYQYIQPAELGGFRLPHPLSDLVSVIRETTNQSTYIRRLNNMSHGQISIHHVSEMYKNYYSTASGRTPTSGWSGSGMARNARSAPGPLPSSGECTVFHIFCNIASWLALLLDNHDLEYFCALFDFHQVESRREGPLQEDRGVSDVRQSEERLSDVPPRPHLWSPSAGEISILLTTSSNRFLPYTHTHTHTPF